MNDAIMIYRSMENLFIDISYISILYEPKLVPDKGSNGID